MHAFSNKLRLTVIGKNWKIKKSTENEKKSFKFEQIS